MGELGSLYATTRRALDGELIFLATNRLYWEERRVALSYSLRFRIDTFYKDAKQNLGFGGCHLRSLKCTRGHRLLGTTAYSLLNARICRSRLYRRFQSDKTIKAECRQAFKDLIQNLGPMGLQILPAKFWSKILDMILR